MTTLCDQQIRPAKVELARRQIENGTFENDAKHEHCVDELMQVLFPDVATEPIPLPNDSTVIMLLEEVLDQDERATPLRLADLHDDGME